VTALSAGDRRAIIRTAGAKAGGAAPPRKPLAARAREAEEAWRNIDAPRWFLRLLWCGMKLPWEDPCLRPRPQARAYPVPDGNRTFVVEELKRWQTSGFIRKLDGAERAAARCVLPAFVSHVRPKTRLTIDLRDVNEQLEETSFRYEALPEFVASLLLCDHLISWDIKDVFHHVYIHPDDRTYLNFAINGEVYEAITMPFGLFIAP